MKKGLRSFIEKLNITLTRQNGEWAVAVTSRPTNQEINFIKANKQELINELREMQKEEIARKNEEKMNMDIKVRTYDEGIIKRYQVTQNQELMVELGLAKVITNWGYKVDQEVVDALGENFTADEARAYAASLKEEKTEATKEKKIKSLIETAKVLGHKVELTSYTVPCNDSKKECDTDIITKYIDGKGEITNTRVHTH